MTTFVFLDYVLKHLKTLFLFTKSDFKTVLFPVVSEGLENHGASAILLNNF